MKQQSKDSNSVLYLLIIATILQLILLYYFKYQNQNLSIKSINLDASGNLINLIIYLIPLLILVSVLINKKSKINLNLLSFLLVASYIFLILGFISTRLKLPFDSIYVFGQFGNKLFTGLCYSIYQFTFFSYVFVLIFNTMNKPNKILMKSFFASLIIMISLLVYSFFYISSHQEKLKFTSLDKKVSYNVVVLGAAVWSDNKPSPILASRIDKAIDLLKSYDINKIFLTGGSAPGELSEAEVALNYLKSKKIPSENIVIEKKTSSTTEQIQYIKNQLSEEDRKNLIIISSAFHLVRIKEISKFHNLKIKTVASEVELSFLSNFYNKFREALALIVFWFFAI